MANSSLVTHHIPAHVRNYAANRKVYGGSKKMITIHHAAGVLTIQQLGAIFQNVNRQVSSNYGVAGTYVGLFVDEDNVPYTNGNWNANINSITIEVSNSSLGPNWTVLNTSLDTTIKLVADIGKRNNIYPLVVGKTLTYHSMYVATLCPGPYLRGQLEYIAQQANKLIQSGTTIKPTPVQPPNIATNTFQVQVFSCPLNIRATPSYNGRIDGKIYKPDTFTITEVKNGFGKLKSGAGWITMDSNLVRRVS